MPTPSPNPNHLAGLTDAMPKTVTPTSLALEGAALDRFLGACHRRRYPNRTAIFMPGDRADVLYFVVDGSLSVVAEDDDGRERQGQEGAAPGLAVDHAL